MRTLRRSIPVSIEFKSILTIAFPIPADVAFDRGELMFLDDSLALFHLHIDVRSRGIQNPVLNEVILRSGAAHPDNRCQEDKRELDAYLREVHDDLSYGANSRYNASINRTRT